MYFLKIPFISEMETLGYFKKSFISRVILSHQLRNVAGKQWYTAFTHTSRTQLQNQVPPSVTPFLLFVKQSQASAFLFKMCRHGRSLRHILSCDGKDSALEKGNTDAILLRGISITCTSSSSNSWGQQTEPSLTLPLTDSWPISSAKIKNLKVLPNKPFKDKIQMKRGISLFHATSADGLAKKFRGNFSKPIQKEIVNASYVGKHSAILLLPPP